MLLPARLRSRAALAVLASGISAAHAAPILWVDDDAGRLARVDVANGAVTIVGSMGVVMWDIAFDPLGNLFGIANGNLYRINTTTAAPTFIGSMGASINSLVFDAAGTLYGANNSLYTINPNTGLATLRGNGGVPYSSSGDLAIVNGNLLLSSGLPAADTLLRLNASNGVATAVGPMGISQVFGLASPNGNDLYAVAGTQVFSVNPLTGATSNPRSYAGQGLTLAYGTAFFGEAAPIPELQTYAMFAAGLAVVAFVARRRRPT